MLTEKALRMIKYMPEVANEVAERLYRKLDFSILYGVKENGIEEIPGGYRQTVELFPIIDKKEAVKVLKTELECVRRNCDKNCGACDLSLDKDEITQVYVSLIMALEGR